MYEPIRTKSVHSVAEPGPDFPHRTREEELDIQLAGHLAALLAVTDELRAISPAPDAGLDAAADRMAASLARLRGGRVPLRAVGTPDGSATVPATAPAEAAGASRRAALGRRAHALAGRALVVAASRADTTVAILAAQRMDAHAADREPAVSV